MALLLQRIIRRGDALHLDLRGLQLKGLLGPRGQHQGTTHDEGRAHVLMGDLIIIFQASPLEHHLQRLEAAAVVELDEAEVFHIPHGADPAADRDLLPVKAGGVGKDAGDFLTHQHGSYPLSLLSLLKHYYIRNVRFFNQKISWMGAL